MVEATRLYGNRKRLPDRRHLEIFNFTLPDKGAGATLIASVGFFEDTGEPAELFLNTDMRSAADAPLHDGAVAISLALQYGCPVQVLADSMKRNPDGSPQGLLGAALDLMKGMKRSPEVSEHVKSNEDRTE